MCCCNALSSGHWGRNVFHPLPSILVLIHTLTHRWSSSALAVCKLAAVGQMSPVCLQGSNSRSCQSNKRILTGRQHTHTQTETNTHAHRSYLVVRHLMGITTKPPLSLQLLRAWFTKTYLGPLLVPSIVYNLPPRSAPSQPLINKACSANNIMTAQTRPSTLADVSYLHSCCLILQL